MVLGGDNAGFLTNHGDLRNRLVKRPVSKTSATKLMAKPTKEITQLKDLQPGSDSAAVISPWSPLAEPIFRALWIATVASNIGTWMQDVGESWLMVSLTTSPMLVALVETAGSLPIVLLALPAGALADVVDRRRLLLITQSWMLVSAAVMGVLTLTGMVTPWLLLSLTFTLGLGTAMNGPAFAGDPS